MAKIEFSTQMQLTCHISSCKKENPTWHSYIRKVNAMSDDEVGWRCHLCNTFKRDMFHRDYLKLEKK